MVARFSLWGAFAGVALCGCASTATPGKPAAPTSQAAPVVQPAAAAPLVTSALRYRCDQNLEFSVRFTDDAALLDAGPRGSEELLRDAGGVTPQQTVYSNAQLRAEFGLGTNGREAILRYLSPPQVVHCVKG